MERKTLRHKATTWILAAVYLLAAANLEVFKVFGDSFFLGNVNRYVWITTLFSILFTFLLVLRRVKISPYIWLITLPIVARVTIAVFTVDQGYRRYDYLQYCKGYYLILFAIPIYYVLKCKAVSLREFVKVLFFLMMLSMVLKAFTSLFEFFTGTVAFPAFVVDEKSRRYGLLRIMPPPLSCIALPMGIFLMETEPKRSWRRKYACMTILVIVYSGLICGSRYLAIWQTAALIYIIMIKKKSQAKKVVFISILVALALLLLKMGVVDTILETFSTKDQTFGGSTSARLVAFYFFGRQLLKNPIWGTGIWMTAYTRSLHIVIEGQAMGDLSDIGFLFTVVQFGLIMLIPMAILIIRLFTTGAKARRMGYEPYCILLWGIAVCLLLCNTASDVFPFYALSVPVAIAVTEYCNYELTRIKSTSRAGDRPDIEEEIKEN